jgi:hypothetical protein
LFNPEEARVHIGTERAQATIVGSLIGPLDFRFNGFHRETESHRRTNLAPPSSNGNSQNAVGFWLLARTVAIADTA